MKKQYVRVAFVEGIRKVLLDEQVMKTLTSFFELKEGVFYFSYAKQKQWLKNKTRN